MIEALAKSIAGLDVHKRTVVCTVLIENAHRQVEKQTREFGTFRRDLNGLAEWLSELDVEIAVMESTGIYWKSVYEALEREEVKVYVVNARHVKNVPGRKTDVQDSEWLAELARCGLLRASFVPPRDLRDLSTRRVKYAASYYPLRRQPLWSAAARRRFYIESDSTTTLLPWKWFLEIILY